MQLEGLTSDEVTAAAESFPHCCYYSCLSWQLQSRTPSLSDLICNVGMILNNYKGKGSLLGIEVRLGC